MNTRSLRGFLQEKSASRTAAPSPRVYLAAFGKHPGWNDHIDDLGFETETLVAAKRYIYLEGIATQIDTGAWERIEAAHRFAAFNHWLLWQRGNETLCAVLVDSRDGKGRTRYPMVLCLHAIGASLDQVTGEFAPLLDAAMRECMAAATAEQVEAILDRTRGDLRAKLDVRPSAPPRESLTGQSALGPENEGLLRVLYQLRNQFAAWAPGRVNFEEDDNLPRAATLRAPQAFGSFAVGAPVWMDFFRSQLSSDAPVLLLWPREAAWFDVIVGPPDASSFFALKANTGAIPLATEVPYQIDDAFRTEALALASRWERGAALQKTIFGEASPPAKKLNLSGIPLGRAKRAVAEGGRSMSGWWRSWSPTVVRALFAVFVVLAFGVGALIYWGTRPAEARGPDANVPAGAAKDIDAVSLEAWRALCTAHFEWFGRLVSELKDPTRQARWKQDAELRDRVIGKLEASDASLMGFSPQRLANASGSADALIATPPPSLAKPSVAARVKQAASVVTEVGRAMQEWGVLKRYEVLERRTAARDWTGVGPELASLRQAVQLDSNLAKAVDERLERLADLRAVEEKIELAGEWSKLLAANDAFLSAWVEQAEVEAKAARSINELREVLARRTQGVREVIAVLDDATLDRKRLAAEPALTFAPGSEPMAQVTRWLDRARGFAQLPDAERPLPEAAWSARLARMRQQLKTLEALARDNTGAELARGVDALASRHQSLRQEPALRADLPRLRERAAKLEADTVAMGSRIENELVRRTNPAGWIASVREIKIEGSPAVAAEWSKRRDQLLANAGGELGAEAFIALQDSATRTEELLRTLATAPELPTELPSAGTSTKLREEFAPVIQRRREAAIAAVLRVIAWEGARPTKAWPELIASSEPARRIAEYQQELAHLGRFADWIQRVTRLLARGADVTRVPKEELQLPDADADVVGLASASVVRERLERVQAAVATVDRARLLSDATAMDFAVAMNAWRALGRQVDWPQGADEIQDEVRVREQLAARASRLEVEPAMKTELAQELREAARQRWTAAATRAKTAEDWQAVFETRTVSGGEIGSLPPRARHNEWLWRMKQIPWRGLTTEEFVRRRNALVAEWEKLPEAGAKERWLSDLETIDTQGKNEPDVKQTGPGRQGWTLIEGTESQVLSYRWGSEGKGAMRLDFRQIEPVTDRPVYLCTTELPVGVLLRWAEEKKLWADLLGLMQDLVEDHGKRDGRRGPRVYGFSSGRLILASGWLTRPNADYYPEGAVPRPPDEGSPLNYFPPRVAALLAESLGCRLPTVAEWRAALAMTRTQVLSPIGLMLPNRRDAAWQRQRDYVASWPAGKDPQYPDGEAFLPPNLLRLTSAPAAVSYDDQTLWFRRVGEGAPEVFVNLIGNVAEIVKDGAGYAVVGASALSVVEIEVETPYRIDASGAYADVGVRLAFTLDRLTPGQKAARCLETASYR